MSAADEWITTSAEYHAYVMVQIQELLRQYLILKGLDPQHTCPLWPRPYAWEVEIDVLPHRNLSLGAVLLWKSEVERQLRRYGLDTLIDHLQECSCH